MAKFTEVIDASLEWTATVLFRPFDPKKWLILGFVAIMAGYAMSGGNLNSTKNYFKQKGQKAGLAEASGITQQPPVTVNKGTLKSLSSPIKNPLIITLIALLAMATLAFLVIMTWLNSRFAFVFLEDVVKNDASIKTPLKANKKLGDSLFLFNMFYSLISFILFSLLVIMCIIALGKSGVFDKTKVVAFRQIFFTCLPYALLLLLMIFISIVIYFLNQDFVLVVMFKDKIKILPAWLKACAIIKANKPDVFKYFFIKIGLAICTHILYGLLSFAAFLGLILPLGILALLFYFIYLHIPSVLHLLYFIVLFILVTPLILFLWYALMCLGLPFSVFFRTLSLKFIARIAPCYNLFIPVKEE